jgi:hypothetical protein
MRVMKPWQWLVFFFSRPIHFSDLSALARRFKPRPKADPTPAAAADMPVAKQPRVTSPVKERKARGSDNPTGSDTRPSSVSSMFHPELEIGVSEQPLDSLPADLQDELVRPSTGRLQGSLPRQGGES